MKKKRVYSPTPKDGKSDGEIAKEMGISREMVGIIRRRAMEKLRRFALEDPELCREFGKLIGKQCS